MDALFRFPYKNIQHPSLVLFPRKDEREIGFFLPRFYHHTAYGAYQFVHRERLPQAARKPEGNIMFFIVGAGRNCQHGYRTRVLHVRGTQQIKYPVTVHVRHLYVRQKQVVCSFPQCRHQFPHRPAAFAPHLVPHKHPAGYIQLYPVIIYNQHVCSFQSVVLRIPVFSILPMLRHFRQGEGHPKQAARPVRALHRDAPAQQFRQTGDNG